jgi:phospholipid/cholesterol/gamma-HCH transport system substrate-binding protein
MRTRSQLINVVALAAIFAAGIFGAGYVLLHERLAVPFRSTYDVKARLTAADGVVPGLGQPVNVAGVEVGSIVGAQVTDGLALITLRVNRSQLPRVYANADVTLQPVTPLGDVEIDLSPGAPPAPALAPGATVDVSRTSSPVVLESLMRNLDADTRSWLSSLIASLDEGTAGRGENLRAALATLGPSAAQVRRIAAALATRRADLAQLVHDLAIVTRAATSDRQLAPLIVAGDRTMHALASQAAPLGRAVTLLPGAVDELDSTLTDLKGFSGRLSAALSSLMPAVARLPATLSALRPFARTATGELRQRIRPFVIAAAPLVSALAPAVPKLSAAAPSLQSSLQVFNYLSNELGYNPGGRNQGYLYWMDWFFHNWDSVFSTGDANGVTPRADVLFNCNILAAAGKVGSVLEGVLGVGKLC